MNPSSSPLFKSRGFYLHACWKFNYPFAVRSWSAADFTNMFSLLRHLNMDRVMLWPMIEAAPAPLSGEDAAHLAKFRDIISGAQRLGLECWVVSSPNLSSKPEIRSAPLPERHLYPFMETYRLDDPAQFQAYFSHLEDLLAQINNANGYVFIDGDPGSYAGAKPEQYLQLLNKARAILQRVGQNPSQQKIIPWIWCGWGADWASQGPWKPELRPLVEPVLNMLKTSPLAEPWELLPGRSNREGWANGRINLALAEEAGLIDRSTLMTYEIIEYEPTPPAVVLQFDDIRRVVRQEMRYAREARGIFGNSQQPIMSLPNLFYFARCTSDPDCLDWSDRQVLEELARFLGGPANLLVPAWSCLHASLESIPGDLPEKLRQSRLVSEAAQFIPGGPERYIVILSEFVEARLAVLQAVSRPPESNADYNLKVSQALAALEKWWNVHGYVFSGEGNLGFDLAYTHPLLLQPLTEWVKQWGKPSEDPVKFQADRLPEEK